ncbi:HNH endonuclease signature motif containing protein [Microbacterium sp. H1-D42]|uniref:HNH endonuclease signature motif containing protein n=1 Tax=Microbacterium sp. H1-D42 TaxID=2925844 RepID=UPI001F52E2D8|nr:HNH endonuclease signature motif containing protein [Microbacterium sp. H1-D42]UNK72049.1 HNH endonuclease [Microbacterium sp. H1-D42]
MSTPYLDRLDQQNALLDEWVAVRAEINRAEARAAVLLARRAVLMEEDAKEQPHHREAIWRSMVAEYSAAGRIAQGTAERLFGDAQWLATDQYALLRDSFETGRITAAHVREILLAASPVHEAIAAGTLTPDTLDLYQAAAVVFAEAEAPARTRAHVREVAAALAGLTINEKHERATHERTVTVKSVGDGMALLQILLPEHLALAILDRLTQMARHQKQHPEDREPTLPVDEDALEEMLHGNPDYHDPDYDHPDHDGAGLPDDKHPDEQPDEQSLGDTTTGSPSDDPDSPATDDGSEARSEATGEANSHAADDHDDANATDDTATTGQVIFGDDDTFTRDPFDDDYDHDNDHRNGYFHDGIWVPPDNDPYRDDPDAYWDWVEKMITTPPDIIQIPADARTLDQIRTDLLTDLLLCADPSQIHGTGLENITATIQVTIAANTLTGTDNHPAQLDGHGELHPDIARQLAGMNNGWTRLFLDPTGMVTETDTYTPTAGMKRYLRARDQHCRFPGCRMPVHRTEIDHTHDHALGGPTYIDNLAHLCKTHHALKHPDISDEHRWTATQLPNSDITWTAPNGRTYSDAPPRRVMFVPSGVPAATDRYTWHTPAMGQPPRSDAPF